jgi:formiminotetrahydrofolate cyclodeaminase
MIRVSRIRTLIEDRNSDKREESTYIEGCEAIIKARKYDGAEKVALPGKKALAQAKSLPSGTPEEKEARLAAIQKAREENAAAREQNEEVEISRFVMHEIRRFETDFGKKQYELCRKIADAGIDGFHNDYEEILALALALPETDIKEERTWRKQEIKNAKQIKSSHHLFEQLYPEGSCTYYPDAEQAAYDLPDDTRENRKLRRDAMKKASRDKNNYITYATPYLNAVRTLELHDGYNNLDGIIADYESVVAERKARHDSERAKAERLAAERKLDKERLEAEKRIKKENRKRR